MITFMPPVAASPGSAHAPEISLDEAAFGDGYTHASPRGLNHIREVVSLRWDGLTLEQMTETRTFFEQHGGYMPFWYQPHGFAVPYRWTCREWSGTSGAPFTFAAKLRQSFSLDT